MRALVLLIALGAGALAQPQSPASRKEAALGAQLAEDLRRHTTPVASSEVSDYVARLGEKLATHASHGDSFTFSSVRDDLGGPTHEPRVLPGGYIFVPASLILAARDETELAGMLAHAIARKPGLTRTDAASIPVIFLDPLQSGTLPPGMAKEWRQRELQADRDAIDLMATAGYDPSALLRYLERTQPANMFRDAPLPPRDERLARLDETIRALPPHPYSSGNDFVIIQDRLRLEMQPPATPTERPPSLFNR